MPRSKREIYEYQTQWRKRNKDKIRGYDRKYRLRALRENPNFEREKHQRRYARSRIRILQHAKEWRKKNKDRYLSGIRVKYHRKKNQAMAVLGSKCIKCGFLDTRALQVDHVNSGGNRERRTTRLDGVNLYNWIITHPVEALVKYQLLCANCNWIKRWENHE